MYHGGFNTPSRMTADNTTQRHSEDSLDWALDYCRRVTRHHARSFYFCAQFLPPEKRRGIYAIYALCRHLDDFVDAAGDRRAEDTIELVNEWRRLINDPGQATHPALVAWNATATKYSIRTDLAEELMRGVLMDLDTKRYETFGELDVYCYRVASVVGLMTSEVFGYSNPKALEYAVDLGKAMQLTNICRDVGEDARMDRIYLPRDEMHRFGVDEATVLGCDLTPQFVELMRFQIDRAREYYRRADAGIAMLSADCRYTVRLSSRIYGQILDRIERNGYDVLSRRAFVPLARKLTTLPSVWFENLLAQRIRGKS